MVIVPGYCVGTTQLFLEQGTKILSPMCIAFKTVLDGICYILYSLITTIVYRHFHAVDSRYVYAFTCTLNMPAWKGMRVVG